MKNVCTVLLLSGAVVAAFSQQASGGWRTLSF
jgi:hypothetical protein